LASKLHTVKLHM